MWLKICSTPNVRRTVAGSQASYSLQGLQHDDAVSPDHLKNYNTIKKNTVTTPKLDRFKSCSLSSNFPFKPPGVIATDGKTSWIFSHLAAYVLLWKAGGTDHHADAALLSSGTHFQSLIHHQVHEGIKSTQDSLNVSASVQLHCSKATACIFSLMVSLIAAFYTCKSYVCPGYNLRLQRKTRRSEILDVSSHNGDR